MSAARTKIFGMDLGLDPKVIVLVLIMVAGAVYYFTSSTDSPSGASSTATPAVVNAPSIVRPPTASMRAIAARRANALRNDHGPLKLVSIDGSRGDVDPTLRLGLLERLKGVPPADTSRNLFEVGPAAAQNMPAVPVNVPKMMPQARPAEVANNAPPPTPPFIIPLKYYGFVRPTGRTVDSSRGLFMDGDNILVGAEGDVLEKHFLIVALTPNTAKLEDTQAKQGQELQVTPEAPPAQ